MASIERTPFQKRILVAHGLFFFSVIFSPFYLSWETQIRYGYIISYLLSATFWDGFSMVDVLLVI